MKESLIQSTKLLGTLLDSETSLVNKLDIVIQAKSNLDLLRQNMSENEFSAEFKNLAESVEKRYRVITDPAFIKKIVGLMRDLNLKQ